MPDSVETSIARILFNRLAAYASAQSISVAWPNMTFTPPSTAYLRADLLWNTNINRGIADDSDTEYQGVFQVTVVAPAASGIVPSINIAGGVAAQFERGLITAVAGVKVRSSGKPSLGPAFQDADRLRLPVSINFYAIP